MAQSKARKNLNRHVIQNFHNDTLRCFYSQMLIHKLIAGYLTRLLHQTL